MIAQLDRVIDHQRHLKRYVRIVHCEAVQLISLQRFSLFAVTEIQSRKFCSRCPLSVGRHLRSSAPVSLQCESVISSALFV
jgi:hypothetical protein